MKIKNLIIDELKNLLKEAIKTTFKNAPDIEIKIEYPVSELHGDYASNIAMQLAKILQLNPREIAEKIIKAIPKNNLVEKVEIAGPGFINLFIKKEVFKEEIDNILKEKDKYGQLDIGKGKAVVIDFSQPNIAKPLGIHHLLSTIIGPSLYNIYSAIGFKCIGENHIGDWGTQFGKLTYAYRNWGKKEIVEKDPINELLKLYVKFHEEAEKSPSLDEEARKEFKKLEDGDKENRKLWKWFCEVSMKDIQRTYDFLGGIHFDYCHGESFYEDKMAPILERGKAEGIFTEGEDGAIIAKFENDKYPPCLVQKSDGATLYATRDLAAIKYREDTWNPVKILYIVDVAQSLHFQQVFEVAKMLKLSDSELIHVIFGRMQFKDAKMSTRKGNIVLLDEVLREAVKKALKVVEEKNSELKNKEEVAHAVGVGALKYAILSQNRQTNIVFDWDKMLSLEGNSAPYLQYSYARAKSILRKAKGADLKGEAKAESKQEIEEKINSLIKNFLKFKEAILMAAQEYKSNVLANYLYDLAQKFNSFYNNVQVLRAEKEEKAFRLKIVEAFSQILKNGLNLLGVTVVEEM